MLENDMKNEECYWVVGKKEKGIGRLENNKGAAEAKCRCSRRVYRLTV